MNNALPPNFILEKTNQEFYLLKARKCLLIIKWQMKLQKINNKKIKFLLMIRLL